MSFAVIQLSFIFDEMSSVLVLKFFFAVSGSLFLYIWIDVTCGAVSLSFDVRFESVVNGELKFLDGKLCLRFDDLTDDDISCWLVKGNLLFDSFVMGDWISLADFVLVCFGWVFVVTFDGGVWLSV